MVPDKNDEAMKRLLEQVVAILESLGSTELDGAVETSAGMWNIRLSVQTEEKPSPLDKPPFITIFGKGKDDYPNLVGIGITDRFFEHLKNSKYRLALQKAARTGQHSDVLLVYAPTTVLAVKRLEELTGGNMTTNLIGDEPQA